MHKEYLQSLWNKVSPNENISQIGHHGAGSRFFKDKNLAEKCLKYLPDSSPKAFDIQPNFDMEMDLLGWYDTKDQSGGQNTKLKRLANGTHEDDRRVMKYYTQKKDGEWLFAFKPQYK